MSATTALQALRDRLAEVTGIRHVYCQADSDETGLQFGVNDLPCIAIWMGDTIEYAQHGGGAQRKWTFEAICQLMGDGQDARLAGPQVLTALENMLAKLEANVVLGGLTTYTRFARTIGGFAKVEYGGLEAYGYQVVVLMTLNETVTYAPGT